MKLKDLKQANNLSEKIEELKGLLNKNCEIKVRFTVGNCYNNGDISSRFDNAIRDIISEISSRSSSRLYDVISKEIIALEEELKKLL